MVWNNPWHLILLFNNLDSLNALFNTNKGGVIRSFIENFLEKEFNFYYLNEKFKKAIDILGWEEFKHVTNEFIKKVEK